MSENKVYVDEEFRFKKGFIDKICKLKGFLKTEYGLQKPNYAELGRAVGFTRQYIQSLASGKEVRSTRLINRFAKLLGSVEKGWEMPFEIVRVKYIAKSPNFQKNNDAKSLGEMPTQYEVDQELRDIAKNLLPGWRDNKKNIILTKIEHEI